MGGKAGPGSGGQLKSRDESKFILRLIHVSHVSREGEQCRLRTFLFFFFFDDAAGETQTF